MCRGGKTITTRKKTNKVKQAQARALELVVIEMKDMLKIAEKAVSKETDIYWKDYYDALEDLYSEVSDWITQQHKKFKEIPDDMVYVLEALHKVVKAVSAVPFPEEDEEEQGGRE